MTRQISDAKSESQIERRKIGRYVPMLARLASVNWPVMESVSA